jgi:hypothetical protein
LNFIVFPLWSENSPAKSLGFLPRLRTGKVGGADFSPQVWKGGAAGPQEKVKRQSAKGKRQK